MRLPKVSDYKHLETVVNNALDLQKTRGSGSVSGDGDGKGCDRNIPTYSQILAECKYTGKSKKSVSIKKSDMNKIIDAATRLGRTGAMFTSDIDGDVYIVMKLSEFVPIYKNHIEQATKGSNLL